SDDGSEAEHDGEAPVDIDAQQSDGLAVGHAGADHHAEGGELQEGKHATDQDRGEDEVDQAPDRIGDDVGLHAEECADVGSAAQIGRHGLGNGVGAEEALDQLLRHDGEAERHQDLFGMGALVEVLDDAALKRDADQQHDGNGDDNREWYGIVDQYGAEITKPGLNQGFADLERGAPG